MPSVPAVRKLPTYAEVLVRRPQIELRNRRICQIAFAVFALFNLAAFAVCFMAPGQGSGSTDLAQGGVAVTSLSAMLASIAAQQRAKENRVSGFAQPIIESADEPAVERKVLHRRSRVTVMKTEQVQKRRSAASREKRDVCTAVAAGVPKGNSNTLTTSFTSHSLAAGTDGQVLRAWSTATGIQHQLLSSSLVPGPITTRTYFGSGTGIANQKVYLAALPNGNYYAEAKYTLDTGTNYLTGKDYWFLNSTAGLVSSAGGGPLPNVISDRSVSVVPLSTSQVASGHVYTSGSSANPGFWLITGGSNVGTPFDAVSVTNSLIAMDALPSGNLIAFWVGASGLNAKVVDTTGTTVVAKKVVSTTAITGLSCAVYSNVNAAAVWINSATGKAELQIFNPTTLNIASSVIVVDNCSSGVQSQPQIKKMRDGYLVSLTVGNSVFAYSVDNLGNAVNGKLALVDSTPGAQSNSVIIPTGSSTFAAGWSVGGTTIVTRLFQLDVAPVVTVGSNVSIFVGNAFSRTLTATDADSVWGDTLSKNFTGPAWLTFNPLTLVVSGTPGVPFRGNATAAFTVIDSAGLQASGSFVITIPNRAPTLTGTIATQNINIGDSWVLNSSDSLTVTDLDGDVLTQTATPGPYTFNGTTFSWTPVSGAQGTRQVTLTYNDPYSGSISAPSFTVNVLNRSPVAGTPIDPAMVHIGTPFSQSVSFTDGDGDPIVCSGISLPGWLNVTPGCVISGTPAIPDEGFALAEVQASDGFGGVVSQSINITAFDNPPQVNNTLSAQTIALGSVLSYQLPPDLFFDQDGDLITESVVGALPPGITFDATTRTVSGKPQNSGGIGTKNVQVKGTSLGHSAEAPLSIQVYSNPPTVSGAPAGLQAVIGASLYFPIGFFNDPAGLPMTFNMTGAPSTFSLVNGGTAISGVPDATGSYSLNVTASNPYVSSSVIIPLTVTGTGSGNAPHANSVILDTTKPSGVAFSYQIPADAFLPPGLTLEATLGNGDPLPTWLTFDGNRTFVGTPPSVQETYRILVRAFDDEGGTAVQSFNLAFSVPQNHGPAVASVPVGLQATTLIDYAFDLSKVFASPVQLSATFEPTATWLKLNSETQSFYGAPALADYGQSVSVTLKGTSPSGQTSSVNFQVNVGGLSTGAFAASVVSSILGLSLTVLGYYFKRKEIKELVHSFYNRMRERRAARANRASAGVSTIALLQLNTSATANATVGMPFNYEVDVKNNPMLKDAQKFELQGKPRMEDGVAVTDAPEWVRYVHDSKKGVIQISGAPKTEGEHLIIIVGYTGVTASHFRLTVNATKFRQSSIMIETM